MILSGTSMSQTINFDVNTNFLDLIYERPLKGFVNCNHEPKHHIYILSPSAVEEDQLTTNEALRACAACERIRDSSSFFFIDKSLSLATLASSVSKDSFLSVVNYQAEIENRLSQKKFIFNPRHPVATSI